jgi:hypothetical protein
MTALDWDLVFKGFETILNPLADASWPIAIFVTALIFRQSISDAIGRIRSVRGFGSEADFESSLPQRQQSDRKLGDESGGGRALSSNNPELSTAPPENLVFDPVAHDLAERLKAAFPDNVHSQLGWALRRYAISEVERFHESNYRIMFGSQLSALNFMNQAINSPVSSLNTHYKQFTESELYDHLSVKMEFGKWLEFLTTIGYLELGGDVVSITNLGRDFLNWLIVRGVNQFRPG